MILNIIFFLFSSSSLQKQKKTEQRPALKHVPIYMMPDESEAMLPLGEVQEEKKKKIQSSSLSKKAGKKKASADVLKTFRFEKEKGNGEKKRKRKGDVFHGVRGDSDLNQRKKNPYAKRKRPRRG